MYSTDVVLFSNFCGRNFVSREVTQPPCQNKKTVELQIHGFQFQISITKIFSALQYLKLLQLSTHGLVSISFREGNLFLEGVGILSLSNYSWTVRLQIVSLGAHSLHYLFPLMGNLLLEGVGILSLSNYACLSSLVMENSCSRQLEF